MINHGKFKFKRIFRELFVLIVKRKTKLIGERKTLLNQIQKGKKDHQIS